jgi:uncharacterized membrane protein YkoI
MPGMMTRALILGLLAIASPAAGGQVSLGEVVAKAEARFEGRVIGAELVDGRREERTDTVYALRLLTPQGAVLNLRFDAATGRFLEAEGRGLSAARKRP